MFKLVYFSGCPNYQPAVELLQKANIKFEEVCQDNLDDSHPHSGYSSPTLLKGDKIIFGSEAIGGGCSVLLPSLDELKQLVSYEIT